MVASQKKCIFTLTLVVRCEITTFTAKFQNNWVKGGPNNSGRFVRMYMTSSEKPGKRAAGLQPVFSPSSSPHLSRGCCLCLSMFVWNGQNGSDCHQPVHHSTIVRQGAPQSAWWEDLLTCCSRYTADYVSFRVSTPTRSSLSQNHYLNLYQHLYLSQIQYLNLPQNQYQIWYPNLSQNLHL